MRFCRIMLHEHIFADPRLKPKRIHKATDVTLRKVTRKNYQKITQKTEDVSL